MIVDERMVTYINSLDKGNTPFLNELEKEALANYVPIIRIFMDAAKGQYINFLPDVLRLLKTGGILLSDNVLQDGDIIESHFAVERRNRTIYKRMRQYLYVLKNHELLETSILPLGDGVTLSIKK